jgi:hypothetical protein
MQLRGARRGVAEARLDREQRVQRANRVAGVVQRRRRSVRERPLEFAQRPGMGEGCGGGYTPPIAAIRPTSRAAAISLLRESDAPVSDR